MMFETNIVIMNVNKYMFTKKFTVHTVYFSYQESALRMRFDKFKCNLFTCDIHFEYVCACNLSVIWPSFTRQIIFINKANVAFII